MGALRQFLDQSARTVFGHDIFISYRIREAQSYATRLAEELEAAGYSCFIDVQELRAGEEISSFLRRTIRRSSMFVLLATPELTRSVWVPQELKTFLPTRRKVVPIDLFGKALSNLQDAGAPWSAVSARRIISETESAAQAGTPSAEVIEGIRGEFTYRRKRTQVIASYSVLLLAALLAASVALVFLWKAEQALERLAAADAEVVRREKEVRALALATKAIRRTEARWGESVARDALQSMELSATPEAEEVLRSVMLTLPRMSRRYEALVDRPMFMKDRRFFALSGDGRLLATARCQVDEEQCSIAVRRLSDGTDFRPPVVVKGFFHGVGISSDGRWLILVNEHEYLLVATDPASTKRSEHRVPAPTEDVLEITPGPKSQHLVMLTSTGWQAWALEEDGPDYKPAGARIKNAHTLALAQDEQTLAVATEDGAIHLYETRTGKFLLTLPPRPGQKPTHLEFSANGGFLAAASGQAVSIWRLPGGQFHADVTVGENVTNLVFSPASDTLAVMSRSKVDLWDLKYDPKSVDFFATVQTLAHEPGSTVNSMRFSADGAMVVTGGSDGTARVFSTRAGSPIAIAPHGNGTIRAVAFCGDAHALCTYTFDSPVANAPDGTVRVWDLASRRHAMLSNERLSKIPTSLVAAPDGSAVVIIHYRREGSVLVMWSPNGQVLAEAPLDGLQLLQPTLAVSHDARMIAIATEGNLHLWRWDGQKELASVTSKSFEGEVLSLAFGGDRSSCLAMTVKASTAEVVVHFMESLHPNDATIVQLPLRPTFTTLPLQPDEINVAGLALSPDCERIAISAGSQDQPQVVVMRVTGQEQLTLSPPGMVTAAAFLPGGHELVTGTKDGVVTLWRLGDAVPASQLGEHRAAITGLTISPDGHYIASVAYDDSIRVWDSVSPADRLGLNGLLAMPKKKYGIANYSALGLKAVAFDSDGKHLLVAHVDAGGTSVEGWPFFTAETLLTETRRRLAVSPVPPLPPE